MHPKPKTKATPKQLRRTGYFVAGLAVFVVVVSVYQEIDYAAFEKTATRVDAPITRVEAIREGKRFRHILHYAIEHRGKTYAFKDESGKSTNLEELYSGSFNAFTGDDPPLKAGKTIGLLVNPRQVEDHRPDRDKLTFPMALWLAPALGVIFLSTVASFLLWVGHEPKDASGGAIPAAPSRTQRSQVSSSREDGVLRVRVEIDVPWPPSRSAEDEAMARLRARMRELQVERGELAETPLPVSQHDGSAHVRFELSPAQDAQLYEARVDFIGASGERASETIQRALQLRKGASEAFEATVKLPKPAKTLRLVLVLADRSTWQHDIALT